MLVNHFDMLIKISQIILPIVIIVATGFGYAKKFNPNMQSANQMNMDIFCPALIFSVMSSKDFHLGDYQTMAFMVMAIVLGSGVLAWLVCWCLGLSAKTVVPPAMFNNTGNMGLPLMVLAFGEAALPVAVVLFVVENTLHFTVGAYLLNHRTNPFTVIKMPMVSMAFLALALSSAGIALPEPVQTSIDMLGQISIPLMLFALGVRMTTINLSDWKIGVLGGLLTPATGCLIFFGVSPFVTLTTQQFNYLLLFAVLPPAVLNYMVAEKYQQQPQQVASIVLMGNLLAAIIIPLALFFTVG